MQAVVLAGGLGTRLGRLTEQEPKPLLDVAGRPFLDWFLANLERYQLDSILVLAGHRGAQIDDFVRNRRCGVPTSVSIEREPQGTGGALLQVQDQLAPEFLMLNGDSLFDFNYLDLTVRDTRHSLAALGLRHVPDASRFGAVRLDGNAVIAFGEKQSSGPGLVNGGVYFLRRELLACVPERASLERDVLPNMPRCSVAGFVYDGFFLDIGTPEAYAVAQREVPLHFRRPAAFLDRDGTLNEDSGYTHRPEDLRWLPEARETIKVLNDLGYLVIVVTNQSGVARGLYREEDVLALHCWMNKDLRSVGAHVDAFYYCPHHPSKGVGEYRRECYCRKPKPGLILSAAQEWSIDMGRSLAVGDKESDREAYRSAGVATIATSLAELSEVAVESQTRDNWNEVD